MSQLEIYSNILFSEEVQNIEPMEAKAMFIEAVGFYIGFLASLYSKEERIAEGDKLLNSLQENYGFTLNHPAVLSTLKALNPDSF